MILLLILVSCIIYGLQLLIFRDPSTTFFYIFQDLAFMPFTIAIATIVVGEVMDRREKRDRIEKTRMLASNYFSEMGGAMMRMLYKNSNLDIDFDTDFDVDRSDIEIKMDETLYENMRHLIMEHQFGLLVISSNPALLDHEEFTDMLWGVFHLMDEFRLRGEFKNLSTADIAHMENDFSEVLRLTLVNWKANIEYMRLNYPNFYNTAKEKSTLNKRD